MHVIDGQAGLIICASLLFYSLTIDNILNIIVLLILAGISISMLSGDNGILQRAGQAREKQITEEAREKIKLSATTSAIYGNGDITYGNLIGELNKEFKGVTEEEEEGYYKITSGDETTDTWTVTAYTSVGEVSEVIKGKIKKIEDAQIAYNIEKNTITMNFKQNTMKYYEEYIDNMSLGEQENIFVELTKAYELDYYEEKYPGQDITIDLIYSNYGVSDLQGLAEYLGYNTTTDLIMSNNFVGDGIAGTIILKKGDTVITQGDVSLFNDLEYTLTESGAYTIIGETDDGITCTKSFDFEYKAYFILDVYPGDKSYIEFEEGLTFGEWIEKYNRSDFWYMENGLVRYIGNFVFEKNSGKSVYYNTPIDKNVLYGAGPG